MSDFFFAYFFLPELPDIFRDSFLVGQYLVVHFESYSKGVEVSRFAPVHALDRFFGVNLFAESADWCLVGKWSPTA